MIANPRDALSGDSNFSKVLSPRPIADILPAVLARYGVAADSCNKESTVVYATMKAAHSEGFTNTSALATH